MRAVQRWSERLGLKALLTQTVSFDGKMPHSMQEKQHPGERSQMMAAVVDGVADQTQGHQPVLQLMEGERGTSKSFQVVAHPQRQAALEPGECSQVIPRPQRRAALKPGEGSQILAPPQRQAALEAGDCSQVVPSPQRRAALG